VKVVGLQKATLEECVQDAQAQGVVLTRRGKPVALVIGVTGLDLEQIELGQSDEFWTLIRARRRQKTVTRAELEKRLAEPKRGGRWTVCWPEREHLSEESSVAELAAWIAVTVLSGVSGNPAHNAIRAKILGVLSAWRRRFGQAKIDELKQQLFQQMKGYRNHRKITDDALRGRIERLFQEIPA
jgi:hypothetical protein